MPECAQRIGPCGAPGWKDGRNDHAAQDDGQRTPTEGAVGRADAEEHAAEKSRQAECRHDAEGGADLSRRSFVG
jgi:hypothetical protein